MAQQNTKTLAAGCFGKVYKEKYKDQWAAIKKVPLGVISKHLLDRECQVYQKAAHPNVVRLLGEPWLENSKWNIPLEFITGEELETTIFSCQKSKIMLTPTIRATIITGMCAGLYHLHSKEIVHQDIKPDNIMVEYQTYRAIIIDLGLAKFFKDGKTSAINIGNEAYSAPEILLQEGVRDKRSDVWAMGKVIAEMCARVRLPTHAVTPSKIRETLASHPYCVAVSKMVDSNPVTRASMALAMSDIRNAEAKVKLEAGDTSAAGAGLQQRAGLRVPSPTGLHRSPSPVESRFQPSPQLERAKVSPVRNETPGIGGQLRGGPAAGLRGQEETSGIGGRLSGGPAAGLRGRQPTPYPRVSLEKEDSPSVEMIQRNRPKQENKIKTMALTNTVGADNTVTRLLQEMTPFPCAIPETGRVQHSRYVRDGSSSGGVLEVKEVITEKGKITKIEGFKVNMG